MVYEIKREDVTQEMWDDHWLNLCNFIVKQSNCASRKIGAVLIKDFKPVSYGWNGPPRGVPECGFRHLKDETLWDAYREKGFDAPPFVTKCPRQLLGFKSGEGLEWCVAGHAERNALINAARHGIKTKGAKMYMNCGIPCSPCLVEIINAGIEEIIVTNDKYYDISSEYLIKTSGLKWRLYKEME